MGSDGDVTPMRAAAITLHEMYLELKNAGFSRGEAMELCARVLAESAGVENRNSDD